MCVQPVGAARLPVCTSLPATAAATIADLSTLHEEWRRLGQEAYVTLRRLRWWSCRRICSSWRVHYDPGPGTPTQPLGPQRRRRAGTEPPPRSPPAPRELSSTTQPTALRSTPCCRPRLPQGAPLTQRQPESLLAAGDRRWARLARRGPSFCRRLRPSLPASPFLCAGPPLCAQGAQACRGSEPTLPARSLAELPMPLASPDA